MYRKTYNAVERVDDDQISLQDVVRYRFVIPYVKDMKVLDIACGTGYGCEIILREGQASEVWGVDINKQTIENNKLKYASLKKINFLEGSCFEIPFEEDYFDVSISIETIEHIKYPEKFLCELKRVTRPNGIIIISTPLNNTESRLSPSNPFHVREYNIKEFEDIIRFCFKYYEFFFQESLLQRNWITRLNDKWLPEKSIIRLLLKKVFPHRFINTLRRILKADYDLTIHSEIKCNSINPHVIIAVIKNEK